MKKINPLIVFSIFSLFGIYGLITDPTDTTKLNYLLYLLYLGYIFEKPSKTFYKDIQKAAAISFFILLFVMSSFLIVVYFSSIGYDFIGTAFWIVSTSMTALLMIVYGFVKNSKKSSI
jgi:predicted membrane protein